MSDPMPWRERPQSPPPGTDVCRLADVVDGGARAFRFGHGWTAFELLVVRQAECVFGYVNECAHLPLPLNIDESVRTAGYTVHCDHHYAVFRFADGRCVAGVCTGASLLPVPLTVCDGRIRIATA